MAINHLPGQHLACLQTNQQEPDMPIEAEWTQTVVLAQNGLKQSNTQKNGYYRAKDIHHRNSAFHQPRTTDDVARSRKHLISRVKSSSCPEAQHKQGLDMDDKENKRKEVQPSRTDVPCPPIRTSRLRPFTQKTNKGVISILQDGSVSMEFTMSQENKIPQIFQISPDGLKVV